MLFAEKANRRVKIADEKKDEYIGMGYTLKNMDGSLLQAPADPKKRVQELEAELKKVTDYADSADKKIAELYAELKKTADETEKYAENAGKRIAELEAENADLKKMVAADSSKKESKAKQTDK